jgi:6-pyruvoyltetrahydropterin/6-carboxytetrahydropterin synthase
MQLERQAEERGSPVMDQTADTRGEFKVQVTKDYLVFAAAHFITFEGHRCETLHGHNYRVGVMLEGALDPQSWFVFDFGVLKKLMKRLCDEIDHVVLLPTQNPKLQIAEEGDGVTVAYEGKPRYRFPRRDCALLPIPNTTVEMLARYLVGRVHEEVQDGSLARLTMIEIEVEENFGQSATYRERLG